MLGEMGGCWGWGAQAVLGRGAQGGCWETQWVLGMVVRGCQGWEIWVGFGDEESGGC